MDLSESALHILNVIDDAVVIADPEGAIIFINRRAEQLAGCVQQEMVGRPLSACWVGKVPWKKVFGKVLQTSEIEEFDGEFVDRGGVRRLFLVRVIPLRQPPGERTAIGVIGRDITDIRNLKVESAEKSEALKDRVRGADAFVSALAHDLRTPLISIQGFVNLLAKKYRDRMDEKGIEYLDRLKREADRMDRLVQDLPRLSQVESPGGPSEER